MTSTSVFNRIKKEMDSIEESIAGKNTEILELKGSYRSVCSENELLKIENERLEAEIKRLKSEMN